MAHKQNIEINKTIGAAQSVEAVLSLTRREAGTLNLVNCVTALGRLAKLAPDDRQPDAVAVQHVTDRAAQCFRREQCQTRHVSQALWACAKLRISPTPLLATVFDVAATHLQPAWFKPQEVSMAVWAVGKLAQGTQSHHMEDTRAAASAFVARLLPSALARPAEHSPQGLANIIGGVAAAGAPEDAALVGKLVCSLRGRLAAFSPQEVANALHGLAKLGASLDTCPGIASEARPVLCEQLGASTPQQLANAAWACAKLLERTLLQDARDALHFWGIFPAAVQARVGELNAQELSMVAWAAAQSLAQGSAPRARDVEGVAGALGERACALASGGRLDAQQLATLARAITKLGAPPRGTLVALAKAARAGMALFHAQDLDNLAAGFSRHELHFNSPKLVAALARAGARVARAERDGRGRRAR